MTEWPRPDAAGRRRFLAGAGAVLLAGVAGEAAGAAVDRPVRLFLCGDVMTGRGIDQILPHPGEPRLYEPYVRSARRYVELAEAVNGPVLRPAGFDYIWGDALAEWRQRRPDLRIVNLETAVTRAGEPWPGKGIHYRMHPDNLPCLAAAGIDGCVLANNHVLDWGYIGLAETLARLDAAGIVHAGAGRDMAEAAAPAVLALPGGGRLLTYAWAGEDSGVPPAWAATATRPGVNLLPGLSADTLAGIARAIAAERRPGDIVMASIHWGGNWGWEVPAAQRAFAHGLVERAGVDLVHGHSSHHAKAMEVYRGRLILYGCGDFINDYEGIGGYEAFRADLALMYFPVLEGGRLAELAMSPMRLRRFRLERAAAADRRWLADTLSREGRGLGSRVVAARDGLRLVWQ